MKTLLKLLVKELGFLFNDYPLESGIVLILIAAVIFYLVKGKVFYIKDRIPILYYFINLRTISYVIAVAGVSQVLRGLTIYDSIIKDFLGGMEVLEKEYPIVLGGIIAGIGAYFIYDKIRIADTEIEGYESNINKYKFWAFTIVLIFIGVSLILRSI
ncbi:hypothetical protein [Pseudotenacibaculum haliotis]|uniref:Uncharacterized protein n=1 Tax=Pseudotenacibaculum haliotis TaxID=1862138 RepID=A0ABW5LPU8_9FLAO